MTAQTVSIELSPSAVVPASEGCDVAALGRARIVWHETARIAGAVSRWFQAGQLGDYASIDLARWSGARR